MKEATVILVVALGFITAFLAPALEKFSSRAAGAVLTLVSACIFALCCTWLPEITAGSILKFSFSWFPAFALNFDFLIDGLSLTFAMLISGIGTLIVFYSSGYLEGNPKLGRFYCFLFLFMASMLGMVLSDNMITLFVFWELTSISSYLLIGFKHEEEKSRNSALQALLVTGGGGLALLAGFVLLAQAGGSYVISDLFVKNEEIISHTLYIPVLTLVLLGAFTKSAQFPFHFWLPNAMEAPTPVSAYLHSATMVKAGIFLMARLSPVLGNSEWWQYTLIAFGAFTMLFSAIIAVTQNDLKKILAYTTICALGTLTMLIGIGNTLAYQAAIGFLIIHCFYKGTLFLVTGSIDHATGTRDIRVLSGLTAYMPWIAAAGVLAALSNAGVPPFFGFIGKELIYEAALSAEPFHITLIILAILANMFIIASAIMAGIRPFIGKPSGKEVPPHSIPFSMWAGPFMLGLLGLLFGIFPAIATELVNPAVMAVSGKAEEVELYLWHGFNVVLLLSAATVAGGIGIYFLRRYVSVPEKYYGTIQLFSMDNIYQLMLKGLTRSALLQTMALQNGYLRTYIFWVIFTLLFFGGATLYYFDNPDLYLDVSDVTFYEIVISIVIVLSAIIAIRSKSVLAAIASLGIVGYGIALIFIFFGATDLAMTQFSIETLTVILFVLVIYKLPKFSYITQRKFRYLDMVIASAVGLMMTAIVLFVTNVHMESRLAGYFNENSYLLAKGRNVVNVILVDFRALDTLGEITVLVVAALGVYTLLKLRLETFKRK